MDFCPLGVFSWWELRLAGGKRFCMGRAGQQRSGCEAALGNLQKAPPWLSLVGAAKLISGLG